MQTNFRPVLKVRNPMALFDSGNSRCALCEEALTESDDVVATSHFIGDENHLLWRYSDANMHKTCFLRWEHRAVFVATYNAQAEASFHMRQDGTLRKRFLYWSMFTVLEGILDFARRFRRRSSDT
jgi:hypothetical protein